MNKIKDKKRTAEPTSTVGRNRGYTEKQVLLQCKEWVKNGIHLFNGDTLYQYDKWPAPTVIVSDGGYGILGFEGDTTDHLGLPDWYEPHIAKWSEYANPQTTLWFWNSEIGWARKGVSPMN